MYTVPMNTQYLCIISCHLIVALMKQRGALTDYCTCKLSFNNRRNNGLPEWDVSPSRHNSSLSIVESEEKTLKLAMSHGGFAEVLDAQTQIPVQLQNFVFHGKAYIRIDPKETSNFFALAAIRFHATIHI